MVERKPPDLGPSDVLLLLKLVELEEVVLVELVVKDVVVEELVVVPKRLLLKGAVPRNYC